MPSSLEGVLNKSSLLKYQLGIIAEVPEHYKQLHFVSILCRHVFNAARSPSRAIKLDPAPHVLPLVLLQERNGWCKFLLLQSFSLLSNPGISSGAYKRLDLLGVYWSCGKTIFVFFHRLCTRILIIFGPTKSSSLPNIAVQKFLSHPSSLARRTRLPTFWRNFPWERYF